MESNVRIINKKMEVSNNANFHIKDQKYVICELINTSNEYKFVALSENDNAYGYKYAREIDPLREVKEAYQRGETIQVYNRVVDMWFDRNIETDSERVKLKYNLDPSSYRIKPIEYVPYTFEDAKDIIGKAVKFKALRQIDLVYSVTEDGLNTLRGFYSFKEALEILEHLEGTPFGKLIEK